LRRFQVCLLFIAIACQLAACANPLNRAAFNNDRQQGFASEAKGDWAAAEIAYHSAAENVRLGNLGEDFESEALFNLGRVKRIVGKFDESEDLLKRALAIDDSCYGREACLTSYTAAELAATYFDTKKFGKGTLLLIRLEPIALQNKCQFTEQARRFFKQIYHKYASELSRQGKPEMADRFEKVSAAL
jgi:tetratricopeptide (TPR) repeat protein